MTKWVCEKCCEPAITKVLAKRGDLEYVRYTHYEKGTKKKKYCYMKPNSKGIDWGYDLGDGIQIVALHKNFREPAKEALIEKLRKDGPLQEGNFLYRISIPRRNILYGLSGDEGIWRFDLSKKEAREKLEKLEKRRKWLEAHREQEQNVIYSG